MANVDPNSPGSGYGNVYLDSLIWGGRWSGTPITYYFAAGSDDFSVNGAPWTEAEKNAFRTAVQLYENVANIDFQEVGTYGAADIAWWLVPNSFLGDNILGRHETPSGDFIEPLYGYFNDQHPTWSNLTQGSFGFITIIHELGHGLGLAHPHDGGDRPDATLFPGVSEPFDDLGDFDLNQGIWTTMSYNDGWVQAPGVGSSYGYQGTPMAFDIAALQAMYGANMTYNAGSNLYSLPTVNASGTFLSCIWDAGGVDEISGAGANAACKIDLNDAPLTGPNAGGFVSWVSGSKIRGGFTIANGVVIENATGGNGNDTMTGNEVANVLKGGAGNDLLDGGLGLDQLIGEAGNDSYVINDAGDLIAETAGGGTDTIQTSLDGYALDPEIEGLLLLGGGDIDGSGNALDNTLTGNTGSNRLDGAAGKDTMAGGIGNDTYVVNVIGDVVTELAGFGTDTVETQVDYILGANLENLVLIGAALVATGNTLVNELTGNDLGNTLDGKSGADKMTGGKGDDVYVVDSAGDDVVEAGGDLNDEVRSSVSLTKAFAGVERYTFTGAAGASFTASGSNEVIIGTAAADTFAGAGGKDSIDGAGGNDSLDGGAGVDTMKGGAGNDTYVVDDLADATDETGGGIDAVLSSITLTIAAAIENLTLTGTDSIDGTGNALANNVTGNTGANELFGLALNDTLTGNAGADTLDGGTGSDRMAGGTEDDTYVVDLVTDIVTELAGGGKDTVRSSITLTLGLEAENLELIDGSAALNATGNTLANSLVGNSLNNILDGKTGIDSMRGGAGDDTYIVDNIDEALATKGALVELAGGGTDTVKSSVSINDDLAPEIENLTLTGTAAIGLGNASNNTIIGTTSGNTLNGRGGNDSLKGDAGNDTLAGDIGNDTMDGGAGIDEFNIIADGAGNDLYIVDNIGDIIFPTTDLGEDTVQSSVTWKLGVEQEILMLTGTGAINGTGNGKDNVIIGNAGANILDGGEPSFDTMKGGGGNDTYIVDAVTDEIEEKDKEGTDLVKSSAAFFVLPAFVENLALTGTGGISGTGNTLNNVITGNDFDNSLSGDAGNDTINGGGLDGKDTLDGGAGNDSMAGGLGDDIYIVDAAGDKVTESSTAISTDRVKSSESFILGANLEELELTGDKDINGTGNTQGNLLIGNFKNNTLDGKTGADTMEGGQGNDTYVIDNAKDLADETGGFGTDTVLTPFTTDLASSVNLIGTFENLTLTGTAAIDGTGTDEFNVIAGNSGANKLTGLAGNDTITGGGGGDSIDGGADADSIDGGTGADTMEGGWGDDTFAVDSATDKVTDAGGENDTIRSSITFSLASLAAPLDIENLTLLGTGALNATGNDGKNFLTGNDGTNVLDGGAGADTMQGNKGNDTFKVGAGDVAMDVAGGGIDTVLSDVGYELTDPNIENLTLNAAAGIASAFGNALANKLTGNDQSNQLDGKAGTDTLVGGKGNDTYFVDDAKDVISELAGVDSDDVQSTAASYTLSANVEQLTLVLGAGNINGTGNTLNNILTGNEGNNSLAGSSGNDELFGNGGGDTLDGGTGNDTLEGGEGDDLYVIDSAGDKFTENGSTLGDELKTNQVLSAEQPGIEHYTFTGSKAASFVALGADNRITGTALADTIDGGGGDNTLSGGAGADRLTADVGDDTYVVDNAGDKLTDSGGTNLVQSSVSFDLTDDTSNPAGTVFGTFQNLTLTGAGAVSATGNLLGNILTGNSGANVITGGQGNDTIDGGAGNDTIRYTTKLDGTDVINNFDGNVTGGQDVLNLDALFDLLSVTAPNRVARVDLVDKGSSVEVRVDTDGDLAFDLFIATINTTDDITVGPDVVVGT